MNVEQPKYIEAMTHVVPGNPKNKKVAAAMVEFDIGGFFLRISVSRKEKKQTKNKKNEVISLSRISFRRSQHAGIVSARFQQT